MKKPLILALLGLGLVAAFFVLSRRASASTPDSSAANGIPASSSHSEGEAAAAGAGGALGALPPEVMPGGGWNPIPFDGGPAPAGSTPKGQPRSMPRTLPPGGSAPAPAAAPGAVYRGPRYYRSSAVIP